MYLVGLGGHTGQCARRTTRAGVQDRPEVVLPSLSSVPVVAPVGVPAGGGCVGFDQARRIRTPPPAIAAGAVAKGVVTPMVGFGPGGVPAQATDGCSRRVAPGSRPGWRGAGAASPCVHQAPTEGVVGDTPNTTDRRYLGARPWSFGSWTSMSNTTTATYTPVHSPMAGPHRGSTHRGTHSDPGPSVTHSRDLRDLARGDTKAHRVASGGLSRRDTRAHSNRGGPIPFRGYLRSYGMTGRVSDVRISGRP